MVERSDLDHIELKSRESSKLQNLIKRAIMGSSNSRLPVTVLIPASSLGTQFAFLGPDPPTNSILHIDFSFTDNFIRIFVINAAVLENISKLF